VNVNEYTTTNSKLAHDNLTPDSYCVTWLNNGIALLRVLEWCQVTADDLTGMQLQQQSVTLCVVLPLTLARVHKGLEAY